MVTGVLIGMINVNLVSRDFCWNYFLYYFWNEIRLYRVLMRSGVGKTCVLKRWVSDEFSETTSTISAALFAVSYDVEGSCVTFNIWDTGASRD